MARDNGARRVMNQKKTSRALTEKQAIQALKDAYGKQGSKGQLKLKGFEKFIANIPGTNAYKKKIMIDEQNYRNKQKLLNTIRNKSKTK